MLGAIKAHLEEQRVLADPLDGGQQVALQGDVRGLPAAQQHAALQTDSWSGSPRVMVECSDPPRAQAVPRNSYFCGR